MEMIKIKKSQILTLIVVLVVLVVGVFAGITFGRTWIGKVLFPLTSANLIVTSITPIGGTIISNNNDLTQLKYRLESTINSITGFESIVTLTKTDTQIEQEGRLTDSNGKILDVPYDTEFSVEGYNEQLIYKIAGEGSQSDIVFYQFQEITPTKNKPTFPFNQKTPQELAQECPVNTAYAILPLQAGTLTRVSIFCIIKQGKGSIGLLEGPRTRFSATLVLDNGNQLAKQKIGNTFDEGAKPVVDFRDSSGKFVGQAQILDFGLTGEPIFNGANYRAIFGVDINRWLIHTQNKIATYQRERASAEGTLNTLRIGASSCSAKDITTCRNFVKSIISTNNQQAVDLTSSSTGFLAKEIIEGGDIIVRPSTPTRSARILWSFTADWVGIKIPSCSVQITSANDDNNCKASTGIQDGSASIRIKNTGGQICIFNVGLECSSGIKDTGLRRETLSAGQTKTIGIGIDTGGQGSNDITTNCKVFAQDFNTGNNLAQSSFDLTCKGVPQCFNEGEQTKTGNCINICIDGKKVPDTSIGINGCCTQELIFENNKWQCTTKSDKPACSDEKDNDEDGLVDLDDPACESAKGTSEVNTQIQCDDGRDNDEDGFVDLKDKGCASPLDNSEKPFPWPLISLMIGGVLIIVVLAILLVRTSGGRRR